MGRGLSRGFPSLPGCLTAGETPEDALRMLREAMASWIEAAILAGDPVPEPAEERSSGRVLLRMPRSLHARLAAQARQENVSINQLAITLLAEGLGQGHERLLANLEQALGLAGLPPGPEREARRVLLQMTRAVLAGNRESPAPDAPGSELGAAINASLRLIASLPPETIDEIRRRFDQLVALRRLSERSA